ncbi:hypothetical protein JYK14_03880 [Siccirubricoccus sp. KC 17139]|uniref:Lipoprotein n=1 Tax=Siccirubricoccus soli TaxID=2899147 RepID=A0ABT1D067_9PROT|nr:hypothetical protein [Siccirubricoccus soli]MCO6415316.1 hypothetical protein [Siccirubricoccus soli]MCP2681448.1 hypothetical protein [Siccirubricoccus soli]
MSRLPALALLLLTPACAYVERPVEPRPVAYSAPAYAAAPGYAVPPSGYAAPPAYTVAPAPAVPPSSYCAEAVAEAQNAAARAAYTGSSLDAGRANRTADYAVRDCR